MKQMVLGAMSRSSSDMDKKEENQNEKGTQTEIPTMGARFQNQLHYTRSRFSLCSSGAQRPTQCNNQTNKEGTEGAKKPAIYKIFQRKK